MYGQFWAILLVFMALVFAAYVIQRYLARYTLRAGGADDVVSETMDQKIERAAAVCAGPMLHIACASDTIFAETLDKIKADFSGVRFLQLSEAFRDRGEVTQETVKQTISEFLAADDAQLGVIIGCNVINDVLVTIPAVTRLHVSMLIADYIKAKGVPNMDFEANYAGMLEARGYVPANINTSKAAVRRAVSILNVRRAYLNARVKGTKLAIVYGPSGSGKTTLIREIAAASDNIACYDLDDLYFQANDKVRDTDRKLWDANAAGSRISDFNARLNNVLDETITDLVCKAGAAGKHVLLAGFGQALASLADYAMCIRVPAAELYARVTRREMGRICDNRPRIETLLDARDFPDLEWELRRDPIAHRIPVISHWVRTESGTSSFYKHIDALGIPLMDPDEIREALKRILT